jgi:hypothetical protein
MDNIECFSLSDKARETYLELAKKIIDSSLLERRDGQRRDTVFFSDDVKEFKYGKRSIEATPFSQIEGLKKLID